MSKPALILIGVPGSFNSHISANIDIKDIRSILKSHQIVNTLRVGIKGWTNRGQEWLEFVASIEECANGWAKLDNKELNNFIQPKLMSGRLMMIANYIVGYDEKTQKAKYEQY